MISSNTKTHQYVVEVLILRDDGLEIGHIAGLGL